ncbi:Coiled-coil domain-containing glutamate-rich protein 1 [Manis javanica]|nr:Coiled-coil domain-containing glutamate-rich protein 1 [Manis javanica]
MRAPHNTTQFIMNQIYEDMRQQEKQKRQQAALQAGARGQASPGAGSEIDAERWERSYGFAQNPNLAITPETKQENRSTPHRLVGGEQGEVKEEAQQQEECARKECEGKEAEREAESETGSEAESEAGSEEDKETETEDEEGADEEQVAAGEEQKGLAEVGQREEENPLPLDIPLSFFVEAEETENFLNYAYLSPEQMIPEMLPEALLMFDDINF